MNIGEKILYNTCEDLANDLAQNINKNLHEGTVSIEGLLAFAETQTRKIIEILRLILILKDEL